MDTGRSGAVATTFALNVAHVHAEDQAAIELLKSLRIEGSVSYHLIWKHGPRVEAALRKDPYMTLHLAGGHFRSVLPYRPIFEKEIACFCNVCARLLHRR